MSLGKNRKTPTLSGQPARPAVDSLGRMEFPKRCNNRHNRPSRPLIVFYFTLELLGGLLNNSFSVLGGSMSHLRAILAASVMLLVSVSGCDFPIGAILAEGEGAAAPINGPEALGWLRENKNESALASNRFGETRNAVRFVEQLYSTGARLVIVPEESINSDSDTMKGEGGPYADALLVHLPPDADKRRAVIAICRKELKREGFKLEDGMEDEQIYLWWD